MVQIKSHVPSHTFNLQSKGITEKHTNCKGYRMNAILLCNFKVCLQNYKERNTVQHASVVQVNMEL